MNLKNNLLLSCLVLVSCLVFSSFSFPVDYMAKVYTSRGRIYELADLQHQKGEGSFIFHDEEGPEEIFWRDIDYVVFDRNVDEYYPGNLKNWRDVKGRKYTKAYGPRVTVAYRDGRSETGHLELSNTVTGHDDLGFRKIQVNRLVKIEFVGNEDWPVPLKERVYTPEVLEETLEMEETPLTTVTADIVEYGAKVYTTHGRIYHLKDLQHNLKDGYFVYHDEEGSGKLFWKDVDSILFIDALEHHPGEAFELRDVQGKKYSKKYGMKGEVTLVDGTTKILYLEVGDKIYGNDELGFRDIDSRRVTKIQFLKETGSKPLIRLGYK